MAIAKNKKVTLGQAVTYVNSQGYEKLALVTGTPETVQSGHSLAELAEGQLHLAVISPTGKVYGRQSVPSEAVAKASQDEAEGTLAYWK